ncbi:MAG: DUF4388 domain-containing protein [bacterium]|nr:DUF4388 domain-containing protein [bacterium]
MTQPTIGRLDERQVPYLLHECFLNRKSGVLVLHHGKHVRQISFLSGEVRHAKSNRMEQRLGQYLMRVNAIDRVQLLRALSKGAPEGPIGQRLVAMGFLQDEVLSVHLEQLLREIVFETCEWGRGEFRLYEGKPPLPENLAIPVPTVDLIFHGFKNFASEELAERVIGEMNAPLLVSPQMRQAVSNMALIQEDVNVLTHINGSMSATQLLNAVAGDAERNLVVLGAFVACGLVTPAGQPNMMMQDLLAQEPAMQPMAQPIPQSPQAPQAPQAAVSGSSPQLVVPVPEAPKPEIAPELQRPPEPKAPRLTPRDVEMYRKIIENRFMLLGRNSTHYEVLGLPIRATLKEVRTAFQHLSIVCDPELRRAGPLADLGRKMEAIEEEAGEAYRILSDQKLRDQYNRRMGYRKKW